jgi:hypothetical protein
MRFRLILVVSLAFAPSSALAWSAFAHQVTAGIADAELTPAARAEVRRILAKGAAVDTPGCPLATLKDASVWPDCVRGLGDRFAFSAPWHYQNIDICQPFDINNNCPDGNCVTAQIPKQLAIVADHKASPAARAQALAFVVHLVGDMHQPLHIGEKNDRGGNDVLAAFGYKSPDRMNLHRIWDSDLAERALTEPPPVTRFVPADRRKAHAQGSVEDWARESWELSRTIAYPNLRDYPDTCPEKSTVRALVDADYVAAATPVVKMQVERAGVRLAMLLNGALGAPGR